MKKAINFDIDTKKYEEFTGKDASTAYNEIKDFFSKNGFEHRQGSGYISKDNITDRKSVDILTRMSSDLTWLRFCVKEMDLTNIGKRHSVVDVLKDAPTVSNNLMLRTIDNNINTITRRTLDEHER